MFYNVSQIYLDKKLTYTPCYVLVKNNYYNMKHLLKFNEGKDNKIWEELNQDDFEGKLENWETFIVISYDSISGIKSDLFKILDWIRTDEKTLNTKYPYIKHRINPGNRYGELPFIEIDPR